MKAALLILALLVHTVYSSRNIRNETLILFNSARSLIAKTNQIANMQTLDYVRTLEKHIYDQLGEIGGCPDSKIIHGYDEMPMEIHLNVKLEKMDEQSIMELAGGPGKVTMGYVVTKCMGTGEDVHSFAFLIYNTPEIYGPPGSQCPEYQIALPNGLCGWKYGGNSLDLYN